MWECAGSSEWVSTLVHVGPCNKTKFLSDSKTQFFSKSPNRLHPVFLQDMEPEFHQSTLWGSLNQPFSSFAMVTPCWSRLETLSKKYFCHRVRWKSTSFSTVLHSHLHPHGLKPGINMDQSGLKYFLVTLRSSLMHELNKSKHYIKYLLEIL